MYLQQQECVCRCRHPGSKAGQGVRGLKRGSTAHIPVKDLDSGCSVLVRVLRIAGGYTEPYPLQKGGHGGGLEWTGGLEHWS